MYIPDLAFRRESWGIEEAHKLYTSHLVCIGIEVEYIVLIDYLFITGDYYHIVGISI
jgi:hypothetical protein